MEQESCAVCARVDRHEIDRRLGQGEQYTVLSGRYGLLARELMRHHEGGHTLADTVRTKQSDAMLADLSGRIEAHRERLRRAESDLDAARRREGDVRDHLARASEAVARAVEARRQEYAALRATEDELAARMTDAGLERSGTTRASGY